MPSEYKPNLGVMPLTASATLNADAYAGKTIRLNAAAGLTVTLPPATGSGATFKIVVGTTVTTNDYIIEVANAADVMAGVTLGVTDVGGITFPTAATSDTITMNGSTTGGLVGSAVILEDVAANLWAVSGSLISTGDEATPFSADVS